MTLVIKRSFLPGLLTASFSPSPLKLELPLKMHICITSCFKSLHSFSLLTAFLAVYLKPLELFKNKKNHTSNPSPDLPILIYS